MSEQLIIRNARVGETVVINEVDAPRFVVAAVKHNGLVYGERADGGLFGPYFPAKPGEQANTHRYMVVLSEPLVEAPSPSLNEYRVKKLGADMFVVVDQDRVLHSASGWFATEAEAQSAANVLNTPPESGFDDAVAEMIVDLVVAAGADDPEDDAVQEAQQHLAYAMHAFPALLPLFEKLV